MQEEIAEFSGVTPKATGVSLKLGFIRIKVERHGKKIFDL